MLDKLLVALEISDMSQHIFDKATSLAKTSNANLMLLHVLNPLDDQYINGMVIEPTMIYPDSQEQSNEIYRDWERLKEEKLNWLGSLSEQAKKLGIATEVNQSIGEASRTICDVARNWDADLIVIGRRGRRGLSELFLGSVSNYVLHHAPCSVLIVQDPVHLTNQEVADTEKLNIESVV